MCWSGCQSRGRQWRKGRTIISSIPAGMGAPMSFLEFVLGYVFVWRPKCNRRGCTRRIPLALRIPIFARLADWTFSGKWLWLCPEHSGGARDELTTLKLSSGPSTLSDSVPAGYFAEPPPAGGRCSDNDCPCGTPGALVSSGSGYLIVTEEIVRWRANARSPEALRSKLDHLNSQSQQNRMFQSETHFAPRAILCCDRSPLLKTYDRQVAAWDAIFWWEHGLIPLRQTPRLTEEDYRRQEADRENQVRRQEVEWEKERGRRGAEWEKQSELLKQQNRSRTEELRKKFPPTQK